MKIFKDWTTFEKLWIIVFTSINLYLFFILQDSLLSLITSLCGMVAVILSAKGKISNYYFGIIKVTLYGYIAFSYALYSEALLNLLFYLPAQFIGLYLWNKHKSNNEFNEDIIIKSLTIKRWLFIIFITLISIIIYTLFLNYFNLNKTGIDALTVILSIVGQILMILRYKEQWLFWILVNLSSIILWYITLEQGDNNYNILIMWIAFLISSIYGYYNWIIIHKKNLKK